LFGGGGTSEDQSHLPLILQDNDDQMMVDMKIGRGILIKHHHHDQSSIISSEREREFGWN